MATTTTDFSTKYSTHLNILHAAGEVIDVNAIVAANNHPWYNQTLCKVNESVAELPFHIRFWGTLGWLSWRRSTSFRRKAWTRCSMLCYRKGIWIHEYRIKAVR